MLPENTVVAVATTTMAAMAENATTSMGAIATTTTTAPTEEASDEASDEVAASSGPSSGPARLLTDDVSVNATTTTSQSMSQTDTSAAEDCECPAPEVVSTFIATLTLGSIDDLAELDFHDLATELAGGRSEVWEVVPVVKIGIQYTLDIDITEADCKAAVAVAYSTSSDIDITEDDVECGDASAAPAPAPSPFLAPAPAPAPAPGSAPAPDARRLQTVKHVTISFTDPDSATAAATVSQDTSHFTTALADEGVVAVVEVSEAVDVSVELTFTVTADAVIEEPTAVSLESAVSATTTGAITVTAEITGFSSSFTRQPCSESDICATSGWEPVADSDSIGCDGESCTEDERERCCARTVGQTGNAQGTCVLGSLFSLLLWHVF